MLYNHDEQPRESAVEPKGRLFLLTGNCNEGGPIILPLGCSMNKAKTMGWWARLVLGYGQ